MYDAHYDLLTIIYFNLKKDNPKANKDRFISDCIKIYKEGNVDGGIINLYFMSKEEMLEELGITAEELANVRKMFKNAIDSLKALERQKIIPKDKKFIYSIEGCDFIENPLELWDLYNMGLRIILPVWNNDNRYGSGNKTAFGLSFLGIQLIELAISLGIAIDLSHANERTFSDIMDIIEKHIAKGEQPVVLASHSNARKICDRKRNLTDEQIIRLRNAGGYLGLLSNGNFVSIDNEKISKGERKKNYLDMISYVVDDLEYPKDKILLATDDMNFNPEPSYHGLETFDLANLKQEVQETLSTRFDANTVSMFMKTNFERLYNILYKIEYKDYDSSQPSYNEEVSVDGGSSLL